jgi:predicted PurR-regulated permease PerM
MSQPVSHPASRPMTAQLIGTILLYGLAVAGVAWLLREVLVLLGVSVLLTYLLLPPVQLLDSAYNALIARFTRTRIRNRIHLPRALMGASVPLLTARLAAVVTVYVGLALGLFTCWVYGWPILKSQGQELIQLFPHYLEQVTRYLQPLQRALGLAGADNTLTTLNITTWFQSQTTQWLMQGASSAVHYGGEWFIRGGRLLIFTISGLVLVFYFLLDGPQRGRWLSRMMPLPAREVMETAHTVLLRFVKGQVLLAVISGGLMWVLYTVFSVKYAVVLASIFTVAEIVPIIGPWFAFTPGLVVMLFSENPWVTVYVLGIYFLLKDNIILPKVVSQVMDVHPLFIILSLLFAANLAGAIGVLFAVPLCALGFSLWKKLAGGLSPSPTSDG